MSYAFSSAPQCLADLIPQRTFLGTSLILRRDGRLLYGLRPPHAEGVRTIVDVTGIGGILEPEDGSPAAGARREAREETGCAVRLAACPETVVVRGPGQVQVLELQGEERPAAVVYRRHPTPPHQPWHPDARGQACVIVFLADLEGDPWPAAELPGLVWLTPAQVVDLACRDVPLAGVLDSEARLVERQGNILPRDSWARLTNSQEALALGLTDNALHFFQRLLWPC